MSATRNRKAVWLSVAGCVMLLVGGVCAVPHAQGIRLYVATDGNDAWSGTLPEAKNGDGPFATLERARDEIRKLKAGGALPEGGATVELAPGVYQLGKAFELAAEDSGTEAAPIIYRAKPGADVRVVSGKVLSGFSPVTDPRVLARLDEKARGKVLQTDLRAQGISDYGKPSGGGLELFFQDRPMRIARWPNEGFVNIVDVVGGEPYDIRGTKGDKIGKFTYEGDRPKRWAEENDLWLHGYWFWDWSDQSQKVESIDTEERVISLVPPYHHYGYRKGQWYYAFNALAELDQPEEWYLDRETGILYFWPPAPIEEGKTVVSVLPTLVTMKGVSHVALRGFTFEAARGTAVAMSGGTGNRIVACTVRNVGGGAVSISGGTRNGVVGCDIYQVGVGGISLSGGDRKTLTPAGHFAENNHIHHHGRIKRMYSAGISLHGVGNRASHNLIDNAPHQAMSFGGNEHVIEFNEIHSVCYESNDAGAIYSGRNWTMRGTVIRYNYMHHVNGLGGRGCVGVYLDDMFCGTLIYGNLFYKVTRAAFIGGGRDCTIENNIFVECPRSIHIDARAMGWAKYHTDKWVEEAKEKETHLGIRFKEPPYSERYPQLLTIIEDNPWAPKGNLVARNISIGEKWQDIQNTALPFVEFEDNLFDEDPHFVDAEHLDFQLKDDSPAYKLGFKRIPIEQIGLYENEDRASWPVTHSVRETVLTARKPRPKPEPKGPPPVFKARRLAGAVEVDGIVTPQEWGDESKAMVVEQGIYGEKTTPRSLAWIAYDDTCLFVAVDNAVDPSKPLKPGNQWGQDDAAEVAIRNVEAGKDAPILILRGYPSGHFESSDEAGAPAAAVKRAAEGVEYKAKIVDKSRWVCEWRVPFASLGIDPAKQTKFAFNLSVRKSSQPLWQMWEGTRACTWEVGNAGFIELVP